ncbi:hypothetical protein VNO80_29475 [Phaseolus coccineus]|uniref:Uncharacterized protein n=1 Tax=Phaseolus coccineus TaxID=3886 RepID=A0AAN9QCG5_PHACN
MLVRQVLVKYREGILEGEELNQNVGKLIMQDVHMVDDPEKMVKRRSTRAGKRNIKLKDYGQWGNRGVVAIEGS